MNTQFLSAALCLHLLVGPPLLAQEAATATSSSPSQPRTVEIVVDLPDQGARRDPSAEPPALPEAPYVEDLVGILSPDDHDALEQLLRSRGENGKPRVFAHTMPLRDLKEKQEWLETFLASADGEPVLFLVFTEQPGTTLMGLSTALENDYGQANLQQWNRRAHEIGRQALGNSNRVVAHVEHLLQSLDDASKEIDVAAPPAATRATPEQQTPESAETAAIAQSAPSPPPSQPQPEVELDSAEKESPAPSRVATTSEASEPAAANPASPPGKPQRDRLGDLVEAKVQQIIDEQQVDVSEPALVRRPSPEAVSTPETSTSEPGVREPGGALFIFGAVVGLLLAGLGVGVTWLLRGRKQPRKDHEAQAATPPAPQAAAQHKGVPQPSFNVKPREVRTKPRPVEKTTPTAEADPGATLPEAAPAAAALPGKNLRPPTDRKFDTNGTEKRVTSRGQTDQDGPVMQPSSSSDRLPLKPRKKIVPATSKAVDARGSSSGPEKSPDSASAGTSEDSAKKRPLNQEVRPRKFRPKQDAQKQAAHAENEQLPNSLEQEFEELQALANAETAPYHLDAAALEEIHERYQKLLQLAPQNMRPEILASLQALVRDIDPESRQKRKNTASREPVALQEERERLEKGSKRSGAGKTRRKDNVY